jgi:pyrimidine deaminase RibD-like protein
MIRLAMKRLQKATHRFAFHGVVVERGGAAIASGYNHGDIHAEINALGKLWPSERRGTKVWSIRVTPGGRFASAKPCLDCEGYLRKNGVKAVIYSDADGSIQRMKL